MNGDAHTLFLLAGAALFSIGLRGAFAAATALRRIIGVNVMGNGVFLVFVALAAGDPPDPVPHAMVLTGIVVAVCGTALALVLADLRRGAGIAADEEEAP